MSARALVFQTTHRSDDVSSQHPVCLLVAEDLHHAVCVGVGFSSTVRGKGELAHLVWDALRGRRGGGGVGE